MRLYPRLLTRLAFNAARYAIAEGHVANKRCPLLATAVRRSQSLHHSTSAPLTQGPTSIQSISDVSYDVRDRMVNLLMQDGQRAVYPVVWLRDSCLCSQCHNPFSLSRILLTKDLNTKVEPTSLKVSDDGESLLCEWSDGHRSEFPADWLRGKSFYPHEQLARRHEDVLVPQMWSGHDFTIPRFSFAKISKDDSALLEMLSTFCGSGLVIVEGGPSDTLNQTVLELSARAVNSNVHDTNYGPFFDVVSLPNPNNAAYTSSQLGLHVDLPFYKHTPGIQVLHCVRPSTGEGGGNEFVDGFYVAQLMKQVSPDAYKLLTTVPVDFYDIGRSEYDFHLHYERPIIELKQNGDVSHINFNTQVRDYTLNVPLHQVQQLYDAMAELNDLFYQHVARVRLRAGETVIFNNQRVLHGREAYTESGDGEGRRLEGVYWNWDEVKSTMRVLKGRLGRSHHDG